MIEGKLILKQTGRLSKGLKFSIKIFQLTSRTVACQKRISEKKERTRIKSSFDINDCSVMNVIVN